MLNFGASKPRVKGGPGPPWICAYTPPKFPNPIFFPESKSDLWQNIPPPKNFPIPIFFLESKSNLWQNRPPSGCSMWRLIAVSPKAPILLKMCRACSQDGNSAWQNWLVKKNKNAFQYDAYRLLQWPSLLQHIPPTTHSPPPTHMPAHPPLDRILDTRLWKHYLSATTVADGNNSKHRTEVALADQEGGYAPPLAGIRHWVS